MTDKEPPTDSSHLAPSQTGAIHSRPPLERDASFWGLLVTQFLGSFNDNLFKQLVLLLCVSQALQHRGENEQGTAQAIFAAPFILFSGLSGFLADRLSKRRIIIACKVAEIFIMFAGILAFLTKELHPLFVVIFLMGTHSAIFAPPKYGILPELFRPEDLPRANGRILMTTFLSIILGQASAGFLKDHFADRLWIASTISLGIAVLGTVSAFWIRPTRIAEPELVLKAASLGVPQETRAALRAAPAVLRVLLATSVFWSVGGLYILAVNDLGKLQLGLTDTATSLLQAAAAIGIGAGSLLAGRLSQGRFDARLVRSGAWGMFLALLLLACPGSAEGGTLLGVPGAATVLVGLGISAGLFAVPLQVYLQAKSPADQKGRILAAMNLCNWIGIILSAGFHSLVNKLLVSKQLPHNYMFAAGSLILIPALCFRPRSEPLEFKA